MGKGTKHASDWKMTTLQVAIDARRLYTHSVKIMGNEKVFRPENDFRVSTLMNIHECLLEVYIKTWEANRINVTKDPSRAGERLQLQAFAIASCNRLLALISYLNGVDHFIKESLRTKLYVRYMDDFHIIEGDVYEIERKRYEIEECLSEIGMELHPKKTTIRCGSKGVTFLGFMFRVTDSGKVLVFRDRKRVKEIRRRMVRLAHKIKRGETRPEALSESYQCVRSAMKYGNSARLIIRMDEFYKKLKKEIENV